MPGLEAVLEILKDGRLEILGLLPYASNATLLCKLEHERAQGFAVYKPRRGERPLWDFPSGSLCLRERAAFVVDLALGWELVPPTVLRDGPAGFGAVQLFIEEAEELDDFAVLLRSHPEGLRRMALYDLLVNNADRKAGHCIVDVEQKLWGLDHGICFHSDPKLRTVLWSFRGTPFPEELIYDLRAFRESLDGEPGELTELLDEYELDALRSRAEDLLECPEFPEPSSRRHVPWPPW